MNSFEELNNCINTKGKHLYTFCFYKISLEETIAYLGNLLDKIGSIKDAFKRKLINDRIYSLKQYFELFDPKAVSQVNGVYLIDDKNKPIPFKLDSSKIQVLSDFKIPNSLYFCDEIFYVKHVQTLVSTNELVNVLSIDGTTCRVIQIDSVKNKFSDVISNIDTTIQTNKFELIFGTPAQIVLLNKKYPDREFYSGKLSNDQIWEQVTKNKNNKNQLKFNQEVLVQMTNPDKIDLFVFGRKCVREAIQSFSVKKIFICPEIYLKYKTNISPEFFNFEINVVDKNNPGDYGDMLAKNYDGVVAIKYF